MFLDSQFLVGFYEKNQKLSFGFLFGVSEVIKQLLYVEPDHLNLLIKLLINYLHFAVLQM